MCRFVLTLDWRLISGSAWWFSESSRRLQGDDEGNPDSTNARCAKAFIP